MHELNYISTWMLTINEPKHPVLQTYDNDPKRYYSYDNAVSNHRALEVTDLVIVRERELVTGCSVVSNIFQRPGQRHRNVCPICNAPSPSYRKTKKPHWRCAGNHEFDEPARQSRNVTIFQANFEEHYQQLHRPFKWQLLHPYYSNASNHSIRPLNTKGLFDTQEESLLELVAAMKRLPLGYDKYNYQAELDNQSTGVADALAVAEPSEGYDSSPNINSSGWTGANDIPEQASRLVALGPVVLSEIEGWLDYLEKRNDPDPPDGFPPDLLEKLRIMRATLNELIRQAEASNHLDKNKLQQLTELAHICLKPAYASGKLFIAGVPTWGGRMAAGFGALKIIEFVSGVPIPISTEAGAALFASGVGAATLGMSKNRGKSAEDRNDQDANK